MSLSEVKTFSDRVKCALSNDVQNVDMEHSKPELQALKDGNKLIKLSLEKFLSVRAGPKSKNKFFQKVIGDPWFYS